MILHRTMIQQIQQKLCSLAAQLYFRLANGGQRRVDITGDADIVKADDAQIARDNNTLLATGHLHPDGNHIVVAKDSSDAVSKQSRQRCLSGSNIFLVRSLNTWSNNNSGSIERSEEHTSELQSRGHLVCRLLLEKK